MPRGRYFASTPAAAASSDAGDCFADGAAVHCLPGLVNIGVQKAGTGELQNWLAAHPSVHMHFFDGMRALPSYTARKRGALRLR